MPNDKNKNGEIFPWQDLMRLGLGRLRLAPNQFWQMTPRELKAAFDGAFGCHENQQIDRKTLKDLMNAFPDC